MACCTFREILTSYMNQIMARLAGSAGFCLSVHIHTASTVPRGTRSNSASGECETARLPLGLACRGTNFSFSHSTPETFPANILGQFNVTSYWKLLRQGRKTRVGGMEAVPSFPQWDPILRVYEKVATYKK